MWTLLRSLAQTRTYRVRSGFAVGRTKKSGLLFKNLARGVSKFIYMEMIKTLHRTLNDGRLAQKSAGSGGSQTERRISGGAKRGETGGIGGRLRKLFIP